MPDAMIHPTTQELVAFGLGKLPERDAAAIAVHLESCTVCRSEVARVSADSFVGKVRAAGQNSPSFSASQPAIPIAPCSDLPPELAGHPKYLILRELGRGGMGVVYQARHKEMDRQVVIKVINRSLLDRPGSVERFRREIRAAAQLAHPNIVTAYDAEQAGESHILVMEFVPGRNLAEVVQIKGPLSVFVACHFARQVALGLQHAYEHKMVHRDIKPQNLMLTPQGQVKILDFGLSKVRREVGTGTGLTSNNVYLGTPEYCAPEQATDARTADIRADLYSLGCTLYHLLSGRPPFHEDTIVKTFLAHLEKAPQPLPGLRREVPAELWQIVARLLAKEPTQRFQEPIDVAKALIPFITSETKKKTRSGPALPPDMVSPSRGTVIAGDTSKVQKIVRYESGEAPPQRMAAKEEAAWSAPSRPTSAASQKIDWEDEEIYTAPAWWKRPGVMAVAVMGSLATLLMTIIVIMVLWPKENLTIEVNEPNPDVFVDGKPVKVSWDNGGKKAKIHVPLGIHKVEVKKNGFRAVSRVVTFKEGKEVIFPASLQPQDPKNPHSPPVPQPTPKPTVIVVRVDQAGADVLVDGDKIDTTVRANDPIRIKVKPGVYKVEVKKERFKTYETRAALENGELRDIPVKLEKMPRPEPAPAPGPTEPAPSKKSTIVLEIDQAGAEVLVDDGKSLKRVRNANEPVKIEVEPGAHDLQISKDGFEVVTKHIDLKPEESKTIPPIQLVRSTAKLAGLIRSLKSRKKSDRISAAQAIGAMGNEAKEARQALCEALRDTSDEVHTEVATALEKVDPRLSKPVVTLVVDKDLFRQRQALQSLAFLRNEGKPALSIVLHYVEVAVEAELRKAAANAEMQMRLLKRVLDSTNVFVSIGDIPTGTDCINTLVALAPDDNRVFILLQACLQKGRSELGKREAARGLARTSFRKEAVKVLIESLKQDKSVSVRGAAAQALGELGPDAKDAVKILESAKFNDSAAQVRDVAAAALRKIKKD